MSLHEHVTKQTFWSTEKVKILLRAMYKFAWRLWVVNYTRSRQWNMRYKSLYLSHNMSKFYCITSCEFDEKRAAKPKFVAQRLPTLYFSQQLQPETNIFVAQQVDHARWKMPTSTQNLQRNNVVQQVKGFVSRTLLPLKAVLLWISLPCMLRVPFSG